MSKILDFLLEHIISVLFIVVAAVLGPFAVALVPDELPAALGVITPTQWAKALALILVLFMLALVYIFVLHQKANQSVRSIMREYQHDSVRGYYEHKKKGGVYCPSCLIKGIEAPMIVREAAWFCSVKECGVKLSNPDYTPPPRKVRAPGWERI